MPDVFTKEKRSEVMSLIKGKGNKRTEGVLVQLFREEGITGWRRHLKLPGRPVFTFRKERLIILVDGCLWRLSQVLPSTKGEQKVLGGQDRP